MDKIARLRQEIERHRQAIRVLNEHTASEQMSKTCAIFQYSDSILSELLSFLDTLQEPEAIPTFDSIWGWYSYIIEQSKKDPGYSERNSKLLADSFLELASRQEPLNLPPFILDKIDDALKNLQESIQRKIQEPSLPSDAEKDLALTADDIELIDQIMLDLSNAYATGNYDCELGTHEFYQETLKRFNEAKGRTQRVED